MSGSDITGWLAAFGGVVAAIAALYAAIYTRRAAEAAAIAAAEAANQVRELQRQREPRATLKLRLPDQFTGEDQVKYGQGNGLYKSGTPIYLDVWNASSPTIMVMEVAIKVEGRTAPKYDDPLLPQILIESGKIGSVNVGYKIMRHLSESEFIDFASGTVAVVQFYVTYFSMNGEKTIETDCKLLFNVTDDNITSFLRT